MNTKRFLDNLGVKSRNGGLIFGQGNAKLDKRIATFSLPAGYSCPGAKECLAFANPKTGKLTDGKNTLFRCYAASQEIIFPNVRQSRWNNFKALKTQSKAEMVETINSSLPNNKIVRIHVSGDFFSQDYFDAWLEVARLNKDVLFYAYTKALHFWVARIGQIPSNLKLNASYGGNFDDLIRIYKLKSVRVVYSVEEAKTLGLAIDKDDSLAITQDKSFALLLHGIQPQGTPAAKALSALKGLGSYSIKK